MRGIRFYWLFIFLYCCVVSIDGEPRPIITLHEGHIGLLDRVMETDYRGSIIVGRPYTIDIFITRTDRYDYVIEQCIYNAKIVFIDNSGCLRRDNVFVQLWESEQYAVPGAIKRTLVHFVASEPVVRIECQLKVVECCGCAQRNCERRPSLEYYYSFNVPLTCQYPIDLPQSPPPPIGTGVIVGNGPGMYPYGPPCSGCPPPIPPPYAGGGDAGLGWYDRNFAGVPWWLWLIILGLLILLLICLCCAIAGCLFAKKRRQKQVVRPVPPPPPPVIDEKRVYTIDEGAQTLPEMRHTSQQIEHDLAGQRKTHLQFEDGGSAIPLRTRPPPPSDTESIDEMRVQRGVYSRQYEADRYHGTVPGRRYEARQMDARAAQNQHHHYQQRSMTGRSSSTRYQQVVRTYNSEQHRRLQRELEEEARRKQLNHEYAQRIERHLEEHRRHPYEYVSPEEETVREETIRIMRQSSVI